ncbi:hypothetical protein [Amycolatopsis rifamycinica]|uniref:hypothetical protein n=1 Tax=Amycolatopsis rifamycinica TaxID=287986 RepID=UPI0005C1DADF|nr:hypothetical protein [Amycolatopsis rifamycinica]
MDTAAEFGFPHRMPVKRQIIEKIFHQFRPPERQIIIPVIERSAMLGEQRIRSCPDPPDGWFPVVVHHQPRRTSRHEHTIGL